MSSRAKEKRALIDRIVRDGLCPDRDSAEKHIRAGLVRVRDEVVDKPGAIVDDKVPVSLMPRREYVGRGALKLEAALKHFAISPQGMVCADVGACTGGFTDVLLRSGALRVYAIDVGYGDLDWRIRTDPRVVVMERTNARYLEKLPEAITFVSIDVSFISLTQILPAVCRWLGEHATIVALVKPQFEAARDQVGEGGIVTNSDVHDQVVEKIVEFLPAIGLTFRGLKPSPILGAEGNKEFLLWCERVAQAKA
jgi:23S rRNA (cytidine1920-2'-O)/16S rRNA (cytidine1409-2'-O)-methyltransferase